MNNATILRSAISLLVMMLFVGATVETHAQDKPVFDGEFIFFINGANVKIPTLNGDVVADPLDPTSDNRVFRINYAAWSEAGFRWPSGGHRDTVGVDASSLVGTNYGESDTLYVRFMSDTANIGQSDFIAFMDTDDGVMNAPLPPDEVNEDADLPFRLRWTIPSWAHDGEWHELAIPLPPATKPQLDSAKAGKNFDGTELEVEVDSLFMNWNYAGAWANGTQNGHWDESSPYWTEFDWEAVKYFGRHIDHPNGGAPFYFDYFSIGVPPEELVDSAPSQVASLTLSNADGVNNISWSSVAEAGGYNIYFSESEITDVVAEGVVRIGTKAFDDELNVDHSITAPHPDLAADFEAHYAVTAISEFGTESGPAADMIAADAKVEPSYAVELDIDDVDAIYAALEDYEFPDNEVISLSSGEIKAMFPDGYTPFTISEERKFIINGHGGDDDADISGQFWLGFGSTDNEFIVYAEITDDAQVFVPNSGENPSGAAWAYDSWEIGLGNYTPESFIISSTHTNMQGGEEPDYQFRAGMMSDRAAFIHGWDGGSGSFDMEIPNSQTIGEITDDGYRLLTIINTISLTTDNDDVPFNFPGADELHLYPFNVAINDADEGTRDTQVGWSNRIDESVDDWWNTPARWQTIAFAGLNRVPTSVDEGSSDIPLQFSLEQNYPNPFNPATKITFTLAKSSDVTLEVFNLLGQKVATLLHSEKMPAGQYTQTFNAANLSSGMYFYRLSTPSYINTRKMMLIK